MKTTLLISTLLAGHALLCPGQPRFISADYRQFYDWFHTQSQIDQLYRDGTTLFVFGSKVSIHEGPGRQSSVLTTLEAGQCLRNDSDYSHTYIVPEDQVNGYGDIWYAVSGCDATGRNFSGYIWGGDLAKGWRSADLTGDGRDELILLGVSTSPRKHFSDINAELRILQNGRLLSSTSIPGLCVFEECESSPMLRILRDQPLAGSVVIEASTVTVGCLTGIEKAFFYWNGKALERVFHAEYTMDRQYAKKAFQVPVASDGRTMVCAYEGEDDHYNPVWNCKPLKTQATASAAVRAR